MLSHAEFLKRVYPAIEGVIALENKSKKLDGRRDHSDGVHNYSRLDNAFIPNGQFDRDVQSEVYALLRAPHVVPTASALAWMVTRQATYQRGDRSSAGWRFLSFVDDVSAAGAVAGLADLPAYWLRLAAYCAIVVYGTPGAALPDLPLSPQMEALPAPQRHPRIRLAFVPGRRPRGPYGDNGEVGSGLPDETHDPNASGWRR